MTIISFPGGTAPTPPSWFQMLVVDGHGRPYANLANAATAVENDPALRDVFARDLMSRVTMLTASIPGAPNADDFPRPVRDSDIARVQRYLQELGLPRIGREAIGDAIDLRAESRASHPLRDWLGSLEWDGQRRLDGWLNVYLGAETTPYVAAVGRMFLVAMVARVFRPGCKLDYLIVFEGLQGTGKSAACRALGGQYFSDALPDIRSGKDVSQHMRDKWLIELSELSAISRAEAEALKAFVSREVEVYRPSYGRREVHEPRHCVFVGTTNRETYLKDETGGRRFWPIRTGAINLDGLARDREQLFAEAVQAYRAGARWWPDREFEGAVIAPEQEARFEDDAWRDPIARWLDDKQQATIAECAVHALHFEQAKIGTADTRRITRVFETLGWRNKRTKTGRFWVKVGAL